MDNQYVELLREYGDVVEKLGVNECGLGGKFPRYAEFWCKHVLTNRRRNDYTKLDESVKPEAEDIINNHYGVFHQLTIGYCQLKNYPNQLIDLSTPLYHFGGAADLIQRTLLCALRPSHPDMFRKLDSVEFDQQVAEFKQKYDKHFKSFEKSLRPVNLTLHNADLLLEDLFPAWKEYRPVLERVRHYRNVLIHSLSPLRLRSEDGEILIPKETKLSNYSAARWSSGNWDINDYAPARQVIRELGDNLVIAANEVWINLLEWMGNIDPQIDPLLPLKWYNRIPQEYEESGGRTVKIGSDAPYRYSGGTLTINDWRASGIHPIHPTSDPD